MKLPRLPGPVINRQRRTAAVEARDGFSWEAFQNLFTFNGSQYMTTPFSTFQGDHLITSCGPVQSVIDRRMSIMGEARPVFQRLE
jgi:hypothetical protein